MKATHSVGWALLGLIGLAACGGTVVVDGTGGSTSTGSDSSSSGAACPTPEPKNHRPAEVICAPSTPATPCTTDADCVMPGQPTPAATGKCIAGSTGSVCDYDQCKSDADCPDPTNVCSCQGQTHGYAGSSFGSSCIAADCHTDADCGAGGFCSPTVNPSCGSFYGTQGFYCHTCKDTCIDDSDCPSPGYCAFDPTVGHWACGSGFCAG